ncbi:hypothetical protein LTR56_013547 [Elasticomyces elasticus]|nr:hypothetical protein LTR56_013547 [Elasticomyces elasticus]KAK4931089.1 hypothetical protein LTR49_002505 [Elasticomyces elasticus]KAK5765557.1 hypothetical protein LTS12_004309 [Elasticomyces elasticus]
MDSLIQAEALIVPVIDEPPKALPNPPPTPIPVTYHHTRTRPMKVLNLGLFRTGTSSVRSALTTLGFAKVYHMSHIFQHAPAHSAFWLRAFDHKYRARGPPLTRQDRDLVLGDCDAVSDFPCAAFSADLIAAYPEAKVILTVRDSPGKWYESVVRTVWYVHLQSPFAPHKLLGRKEFDWLLPDLFRMGKRMFGDVFQGDFPRTGLEVYNEHIELIQRLVSEERLLVFNVREGWEPFCKFLDVEVPEGVDAKVFPCVNAGQAVVEMVLAKQAALRKSMRQMVCLMIVGLVLLLLAWQRAHRRAYFEQVYSEL